MSSSRLEEFRRVWAEKAKLTANEHWEESIYYMCEADKKKQLARDDALTQLDDLRNRDTSPANFDDEARKIKENLDAILESIEKEYNEIMRGVKEIQQKEKEDHEKAYHKALAARPFMNNTSLDHSATTTVATIDSTTALKNGDTDSASRTSARISPGPQHDPMVHAKDAIPTTTAPKEQDQPAVLGKHFSCTVQREYTEGKEQYVLRYKTENRKALQEITEPRADQSLPADSSVNPLATPATTASASENKLGVSRTITFDEVYQNGQAKHKDTIVEFPHNSRQWYIIKCEEHKIRFGLRPLMGAAKHLNGRLHGGLERSRAVALKTLGYRVVDCTEELAALNNEVVNKAFAEGYVPVSINNPENKANRKQKSDATVIPGPRKGSGASQKGCKGTWPPFEERLKAYQNNPTQIITNPKTFHVYYCFWKPDRSLYPVMILGWDDQKPGGLEHDLVSTGLLDKDSKPPNCYIYKDTDSGKNKAIAGWAPGFQDGGMKVAQRKFPAMFFDSEKGVSWVSADLLSKFPLFNPDPPKKRSHPFNVARRWIAKNEGFASWEEFEEARKGETGGTLVVPTPSVSPLSDINDAGSESDTEGSTKSNTSNVTEKELREMLDQAGEITGDSDYAGSDADSTLEDEREEWEQVEADGRPWAWYGLRNKTNTSPQKTEPSTPTLESNPANVRFSVQEGMKTAHRLSIHACAQDDSLAPEDPPIKTVENQAQDGDDKSSRSTLVTNLYTANAVNQATLPPKRPVSRHITQADDNCRVEGDFRAILRTPTRLLNRPSPSLAESGEISRGMKRARSEEGAATDNGTPRQESAKKLKQGIETSNDQVTMSIDSEPEYSAPPPVASSFKPKEPLGPAVFELSSYSKGLVSWNRESEETSLKLYYGDGDRVLGTVDALVDIVIDPTTLRGIAREEIPESKGNVVTTLFGKTPGDASVKMVFDRPMGSRADIGKVQSRKFLRWIRGIVPTLPLLEG
ncbi:hypothetical protein F4801DRAFT_577009 [Xylaria longipes]|nr:hypothetical protein F4801DRAFT_577009 [Xylaria longipes]RYC58269.1 hypothetical protein CHU98_g7933 [Xylaria longipes]